MSEVKEAVKTVEEEVMLDEKAVGQIVNATKDAVLEASKDGIKETVDASVKEAVDAGLADVVDKYIADTEAIGKKAVEAHQASL